MPSGQIGNCVALEPISGIPEILKAREAIQETGEILQFLETTFETISESSTVVIT